MYIFNGENFLGSSPSSQSLTSATSVLAKPIAQRINLKRLQFLVTTAVSSSSSVVLTFYYRPVAGSASNQVTLGTLTIPTGVAAGKVYYKDIAPYSCTVGGDIAVSVTTAATSAGAGYCGFGFEQDPETALNESSMVASA